MRRHDLSNGRMPRCAWSWLILFANCVASASLGADDGAGSDSASGPRTISRREAAGLVEPETVRAQLEESDISNAPGLPPLTDSTEPDDSPAPERDDASPPMEDQPATPLEPLPGRGTGAGAPPRRGRAPAEPPPPPTIPFLPGSQRVTRIYPRGGPGFESRTLPTTPEGVQIAVIRGGVFILTNSPQTGTIDIEADSAVIWRRPDARKGGLTVGPNGEQIEDAGQPMEVYLEGNVVVRQDERKVAGNGDQKTYRASQAYYDFVTDRFVGLDADLDIFAPGLIAPSRVTGPRIDQFRPVVPGPNGAFQLGLQHIQADHIMMTGSRFPNPGYRFRSRSIDLTRIVSTQTDPNSGRPVGDPRDPNTPNDLTWQFDARQNAFFLGPVPIFYWPRIVGEADDLEPPLRGIMYRYNNYFGHQILTDWNGFKVFGIKKLPWVDTWNLDLDYLSARTKKFPALGSEIGWFGTDLLADLSDPYRQTRRGPSPTATRGYFGYFDIWGLYDNGVDILGSGPAVITNNKAAGKRGYQRGVSGIPGIPNGVPPFQKFRGRITARHMQSLLTDDIDPYEDWRVQLEFGLVSDRHFLEEYYKRLFDVGLDQETLAYMIRQRENHAWTLWTEANLNNWYTESQWLPRLDYYRMGDSLFDGILNYSQHSGVDYANTHTAVEVNNPFIFAFIPYDPISNTSSSLSAGRAFTTHELDMPIQYQSFRLVPYVQGQLVGWSNQINGQPVGRAWGAAGARAEIMAWRKYPNVSSELFNVHGLMHKINFSADYRDAYSNVKLDRIGVQDDLDDNTYEFERRYFALTNFAGGLLPAQYDPRHLILRRALSPISGPVDIQASIETLQLGIHQRLQTKRGPVGKRRVIDYMTLDLNTTYFPYAKRDNFDKSFGQNMYNYQWFIGDRTSIISYGWFEFFNIGGVPLYKTNTAHNSNPFGLNVITSGFSISRPPRANLFLGYTVINTGPINTSALNVALSYWLSPKWYGTFTEMYDFGNRIPLATLFSFTRVGADYLVSVGLTVDPQRNSYMFALQISPRISPNVRLGSGAGPLTLDTRYAPTQ